MDNICIVPYLKLREVGGGGGSRCTYKPHIMAFHLTHMSKEEYNVVYFLRKSFFVFLHFFDKTFEPQLCLTRLVKTSLEIVVKTHLRVRIYLPYL